MDTDPEILHDVTVLIPTLGRDIIETCLHALSAGRALPRDVVVVDQGRNRTVKEAVETLSHHGIRPRYLPSDTTGRASGLNIGIANVTTRFLAVTDDDCVPDPTWIERMHRRLLERPGSVVTGRVAPEPGGSAISTYGSTEEEIHTAPLIDRGVLAGGNMGVATEVLALVGPFDTDPRLANAEDGDWEYRALRAGVPIVYAPEVCVVHTDWRNRDDLIATCRGYARSLGGLYGKYIRRGDWFMARRAIFDTLRGPWLIAKGALGRHEELRLIGLAYVRHLLPGLTVGLRKGAPTDSNIAG